MDNEIPVSGVDGWVTEVVESDIQTIRGFAGCQVVELNVQPDHVRPVMMGPPKLSIS